MFWVVGMIHLWIRRIPSSLFLAGLPLLMLFMYVYGFYKSGGREGLEAAMSSADARAELENQHKRSLDGALLGDLGRSDVQACLLSRTVEPDSDVVYAWGRTYWCAMMVVIPKNIWPDRPDGAQYGTEALYGRNTYDPDTCRSSRIYGLAGEAILNFGFWAVPIAFAVFGAVVGSVRRFMATCPSGDVRQLLLPVLTILCLLMLSCNLDNVIFFCLQFMAVPAAAIGLGTTRQPSPRPATSSTRRCPVVPSLGRLPLRRPDGAGVPPVLHTKHGQDARAAGPRCLAGPSVGLPKNLKASP
jgi:hypothetical protein